MTMNLLLIDCCVFLMNEFSVYTDLINQGSLQLEIKKQ